MCRRWSQVTVQSVDHLHSSCRTAMVVTAPLPAITWKAGFVWEAAVQCVDGGLEWKCSRLITCTEAAAPTSASSFGCLPSH